MFARRRDALIASIRAMPEGAGKEQARRVLMTLVYLAWKAGKGVSHE